MYKIAVIGDRDSICGFAALGLEIYPIENKAQIIDTFRKVISNGYAVIYITESMASQLTEEINKYKTKMTPAIILIPGIIGNTGMGLSGVKKTAVKAVGSDILN
jgi:V/A-type H+/Na+-transporting ATPase subunit F